MQGLVAGSGSWENIQEVIRSAFREVFLLLQQRADTVPGSATRAEASTLVQLSRVVQEQDAAIRSRDSLLASLAHDVATLAVTVDGMQREAQRAPSQAGRAESSAAPSAQAPACTCIAELRALRAEISRSLETKADASDVTEQLAGKASKSSVVAALNRKANKDKVADTVDALQDRVSELEASTPRQSQHARSRCQAR